MRIFPALLFVAGIVLCSSCTKTGPTELVFADASDVWWTAPTIIAQTHDCFDKDKVKVKSFDVTTGLASKNAVVAGTAEVGLVAATPLAMGAYKEKNLRILCSYVESRSLIAFLRGPGVGASASKEIPEPVAIVPRTISEWFFENYCTSSNLVSTNYQRLYSTPPDVPNQLKTGKAKSAVIWEPFASLAVKNSGATIISRDTNCYTVCLFLVTRDDVLKNKKKAVDAFVAGVKRACDDFINKDPVRIRQELERRYQYPEGFLSDRWGDVDFAVKTDTKRMRGLIEEDVKIALRLGYTPEKTPPDLEHLFDATGK